MILGIQFNKLHPETLFTLPNGLAVYKSKLLPASPKELACIGGPIEALDTIVVSSGAKSAIRYMGHLIRNVSAGNIPRMEFFPNSMIEMEKCQERFVDREIPGIEDLLNINALEKIKFEDLIVENDERIEANECDAIVTKPFDESNIKATSGILFDKYKKTEATEMKNIEIKRVFSQNNKEETHDESDVVCDVCKKIFKKDNASMTVQAELRRFLDQQEAGLDSSFRCIRCRD